MGDPLSLGRVHETPSVSVANRIRGALGGRRLGRRSLGDIGATTPPLFGSPQPQLDGGVGLLVAVRRTVSLLRTNGDTP